MKKVTLLLTICSALMLSSTNAVIIQNNIPFNKKGPCESLVVLKKICDHGKIYHSSAVIELPSEHVINLQNVYSFQATVDRQMFPIKDVSDKNTVIFYKKGGRVLHRIDRCQ